MGYGGQITCMSGSHGVTTWAKVTGRFGPGRAAEVGNWGRMGFVLLGSILHRRQMQALTLQMHMYSYRFHERQAGKATRFPGLVFPLWSKYSVWEALGEIQ